MIAKWVYWLAILENYQSSKVKFENKAYYEAVLTNFMFNLKNWFENRNMEA